jgi:hypothetical protein
MQHMKRMMLSLAAALAVVAIAPFATSAQTLPQSTMDRQAIANLQYRLTLPSTTPTDQREIQEHISQLQYQINTRAPITSPAAPHDVASPGPSLYTTIEGNQITLTPAIDRANGLIQLNDSIYTAPDMCSADYGMIVYLNYVAGRSDTSYQEKTYIPHVIDRIQHQMRNTHCPAA